MITRNSFLAATICFMASATALGQTKAAAPENAAPVEDQSTSEKNSSYLDKTLRSFNDNFHLGPGDEISIRVKGQPAYSLEKSKISPTGTIYLDLVGEIGVVGMTISQLNERLTDELSEYLKNPQVNVLLLEAESARISVFGEVNHPGTVVMSRPMRLLDAISEAGGFSSFGSKNSVEVLRQDPNGNRIPMRIDVKKYLEGKGSPENNIPMLAGDLVMVHGNGKKTLETVGNLTGLGSFISIIARGW